MPMEGFRALGLLMEEPKRFHGGKGYVICVSRELRVTGRGRREKGWAKGLRFERVLTLAEENRGTDTRIGKRRAYSLSSRTFCTKCLSSGDLPQEALSLRIFSLRIPSPQQRS
ncbi:hypothetical protein AMTRI_Chr03g142340 [Amborella trichopoda]